MAFFSTPVSLPGAASAVPAMDWSPDGELAVALGDRVDLLIPNVSFPKSLTPSHRPTQSESNDTTTEGQHTTNVSRPTTILTPSYSLPFYPPLSLPTNLFSELDRPIVLPPLSFANWSIGEEISRSHVTSIRWSGAGLLPSPSRRAALGVLTSNLILSLWALNPLRQEDGKSGGSTSNGSSGIVAEGTTAEAVRVKPTSAPQSGFWERACVVNRAIEEYVLATEQLSVEEEDGYDDADHSEGSDVSGFKDLDLNGEAADFDPGLTLGLRPQFVSSPDRERRVRRCRIRAFTWLPPLYLAQKEGVAPAVKPNRKTRVSGSSYSPEGLYARISGHHLLMVANDWNEVIILAIRGSPFQSSNPNNQHDRFLHAQVVHVHQVGPIPTGSTSEAHLFEDTLRSRAEIRNIVVQKVWSRPDSPPETECLPTIRFACTLGPKVLIFDLAVGPSGSDGYPISISEAAEWERTTTNPQSSIDYDRYQLSPLGPLAWAPKLPGHDKEDFLVVALSGEIYCLGITRHAHCSGTPDIAEWSYKFGPEYRLGWDSVSDFSFAYALRCIDPYLRDGHGGRFGGSCESNTENMKCCVVQFCFQLSSRLTTPLLRLPTLEVISVNDINEKSSNGGGNESHFQSPWQRNIETHRRKFCESNGLKAFLPTDPSSTSSDDLSIKRVSNDVVLTRMSGLISSPLGDLVATCSSDHPARMLEYRNAADENVWVHVAAAAGSCVELGLENHSNLSAADHVTRSFSKLASFRMHSPDGGIISTEYLAFSLNVWIADFLRFKQMDDTDRVPYQPMYSLSELFGRLSTTLYMPHHVRRTIFPPHERVFGMGYVTDDDVSMVIASLNIDLSERASHSWFNSTIRRTLQPYFPNLSDQPSFVEKWYKDEGINTTGVSSLVNIHLVRSLVERVILLVNNKNKKGWSMYSDNYSHNVSVSVSKQQDELIFSLYVAVRRLVKRLKIKFEADDWLADLKTAPGITQRDLEEIKPPPSLEELSDGEIEEVREECDFCASPIILEDLRMARCARGHQFARCSLTFLAIQQPGISKRCGMCGLVYLSDAFLLTPPTSSSFSSSSSSSAPLHQSSVSRSNSAVKDLSVSLSEVLCRAVDRCLHCGGKFICR